MKDIYNSMLDNMLCNVVVTPEIDDQDTMFIRWKILSTHKNITDRPEDKDDEHIAIYDIKTKQWIHLELENIISIEYPFFDKHVTYYTVDTPEDELTMQVYDQEEHTMIDIALSEQITEAALSPAGWIHEGCNSDLFDKVKYESDISNFIDSLTGYEGKDPWKSNFDPTIVTSVADWNMLSEIMYDSFLPDLYHDQVDMKLAADCWNKLIVDKSKEAIQFLTNEKAEIDEELAVHQTVLNFEFPLNEEVRGKLLEAHPEYFAQPDDLKDIEEIINSAKEKLLDRKEVLIEEIEEIDVIIKLIRDQVVEYKDIARSCETIYELRDVWPPILLPMPLRHDNFLADNTGSE